MDTMENNVQAAAYSFSAMPKSILLYVGTKSYSSWTAYPSYSNADLDALLQATKEFVLCTGGVCYNYYNNGTAIITNSVIDSILSTDIQYANTLATIQDSYKKMLSTSPYNGLYRKPDPSVTLELNIAAQVNLANQIIARDSSAVIWFSFPHIDYEACAQYYKTPFTYLFNSIKSQIGTTKWNNNVRGFYWGAEQVTGYYTKFDSAASSSAFNNRHVQLMKDMSDLVHNNGKQFIWMPYVTTDTSTSTAYSIIRTGYIANKTNIFNYVFLQPGYYQHADRLAQLNSVKTSVTNNKVYNNSGTVTGSTKTSSTKIGVVMEIDSKIAGIGCPAGTTWQEYNDRYYEYTLRFNPLKTAVPVCYYAGDRDSTMNTTVKGYITTFYNY